MVESKIRKQIIDLISDNFNATELQGVYIAMGLAYDSLSSGGVQDRATELVEYLARRGNLPKLLYELHQLRPNLSWPEIPHSQNLNLMGREEILQQAAETPATGQAMSKKQETTSEQNDKETPSENSSIWKNPVAIGAAITAVAAVIVAFILIVSPLIENNRNASVLQTAQANQSAIALAATQTNSPSATPTNMPTETDGATPNPIPTATATETALLPTPTLTETPTSLPEQTDTPDPAKLPTAPTLESIWVRSIDDMVMVYVPGGRFRMGSNQTQVDAAFQQCETEYGSGICQIRWFEREYPEHLVQLSSFWIDRTEVTNEQFVKFLEANFDAYEFQKTRGTSWLADFASISEAGVTFRIEQGLEEHPVFGISWDGADRYCNWAGGELPTEAQWEYAARGPEGFIYPWGNNTPTCELAQFRECTLPNSQIKTLPAGSLPNGASWVGALNMSGNVWEWVQDRFDIGYYFISPVEDPEGPNIMEADRIRRGGGFDELSSLLRAAYRLPVDPENRSAAAGFRCVVLYDQ